MNKLPDRTGILISPISALLAGGIFSALLVTAAMNGRQPSRKVMDQMLVALAESLGVVPSIVVSVVITLGALVYFVMRFRYYRSRVAEDKKAAALT